MQPPIAPTRPHVHRHHGHERADPYHWLSDRDDPAVRDHLVAENAYAEDWFCGTGDLRDTLYAEMTARVVADEDTVPVFEDGYWWYRRWTAGHEHGLLCRRRASLEAAEEVYLDVDRLAEGYSCFLLGAVTPTRDGRLVAYACDRGGDRRFEIRIRDTVSGEDLPDRIVDSDGSGLVFSPDGAVLFYIALDPETLRGERVMRHRLGTPPADDIEILRETDETFELGIDESRSRAFLLIASSQTLSDEWWALALAEPEGSARCLIPRERGHECDLDHYRGRWYRRSNRDAINFRYEVSAGEDALGDWSVLIDHDPEVLLEDVTLTVHGLAVEERCDGRTTIRLRSWDGSRDERLAFAEPCHTVWVGSNPDPESDRLRIGYTSMIEPVSVIDIDWRSGERELRKRYAVAGGYEAEAYHSERLEAVAPDGTRIPISLCYRRDRRGDAGQPLLLCGYGSYGATMDPHLDLAVISLLDRGVIYAIAHIRGGQAKGRAWYEAGRHEHKEHSFEDFAACADHLIASGWADPARLACEGHSAGGLLVGAVLNRRPELFAATIAGVPFVDCLSTMLDASIPLTTGEYDEWGDPNREVDYQRILAWSPYDNVRPQRWPALLVTAGFYDTQVHYWEPAKWVARIRETMTGGGPVLLVTELEVGHAGATGRYGRFRDSARDYAFVLAALGITKS